MTCRDPIQVMRAALKVETELHGKGTRCDVVCAVKSGKEIVERGLVRQVDGGEPQAPLVTVAVTIKFDV